jgi:hypothetical protein
MKYDVVTGCKYRKCTKDESIPCKMSKCYVKKGHLCRSSDSETRDLFWSDDFVLI